MASCSSVLADMNLSKRSTHQESPRLFSESHGLLGSSSDSQPVQDAGLDMTWSVELYANIYLAHVHKMYPFLHEASIRRWMRTCSRGHALEGDHKGFILRILCAIGAYMCSSFGETCPHLKEATSLSQQAFTRFHSGTMKKSPVIRAQVCLLALFHAIYGPRSESIHETLASALTECARVPANTSHDSFAETPPSAAAPGDQSVMGQQEDTADYEDLRRNIIFSCHQVNEIIACGWDRSQEDVLRSFDDEVRFLIYSAENHVRVAVVNFFGLAFHLHRPPVRVPGVRLDTSPAISQDAQDSAQDPPLPRRC